VRLISNRYLPGGLAYVYTFTKNETVGEVIDVILAEADEMQTVIVPDSEHVGAINYRCGVYPLGFETNDQLAGVFSSLWLNQLDRSYYEDYQENLRAVTAEQTMAVAKKYFPKDNYRLVLVGKADEIIDQAEKFGPVTVIPLAED
jgi:predicted Zn-dependent peptidase